MAQFVDIAIDIDGKSIRNLSSLAISQGIFAHHTFRLVCPTEAIDGMSGSILNTSKDMIGGKISIQLKVVGGQGQLQFSGVITLVEASRHSGHAGDIIISGFSPTILLDNGPHCASWEKKAVKNIAQDVLKNFPQNLLSPKIAPAYGETLSYTVQYKESAWQFLSRLSAIYGEWFYYDGQKLVLGPPQGETVKLTYGSDLHSFNMALQVRPANFQAMAYDYMNAKVYAGAPSGVAGKAGLNDLGKLALQKSDQFYGTQPKQWYNNFVTSKKQLDDFVNTRAAMQSSNMVRFNGSSGNPAVQTGGTVNVQGRNVFNQQDESFGDYTVISVNHHCDGQGNYSNDFVAIPSTVKMPPVAVPADVRCETQSALVTDNHDPQGLGRVRVKFHWMDDGEKSPWLRIASPHGGNGKGMFFIPETGEEVIVGFEGESPNKPFVIGTVWHGQAKTSFSNDANDVKAIQTRSGNMIILNDQEGSVHVADAKGNNMKIDGKGNVNITANETIVLACGDSTIKLNANGEITFTGKKITITGDNKVSVVSGQASFVADGDDNKTSIAANNVNMKADMNAEIKAGMAAKISGDMDLKMEGGMTTGIKGGVMVTVQGAIIQLN